MWGNKKQYLCGAIENALLANSLFPGWITRFYCSENVPAIIINDLSELGAEIVKKNEPVGYLGLFWRFEAANDDDVERFIVRDTDSRLTPRDAAMVQEWEDSESAAHIIRDCASHCAWMLGATWGIKPDVIVDYKELVIDFWADYYNGKTEHGYESNRGLLYGVDQEFLSRKIFPLIRDNHLAHIADYPCLRFTGREKLAPPINRKEGDTNLVSEPYVGQVCNLEPKYDNYDFDTTLNIGR